MAKKKGGKGKGKKGKGKSESNGVQVPLEPEMMPLLYRKASFDTLPKCLHRTNSFTGLMRVQNDRNHKQIVPGYASFLKAAGFIFSEEKAPDNVAPKVAVKKKKAPAKKKK